MAQRTKPVFDRYCGWFFEITEYMERHFSEEVPEIAETRALSYVAEVLTNLYFMYHGRNLNRYYFSLCFRCKNVSFHTAGVNRISIGNSSSLPASISKIRTHFVPT